VIVRRILHAVRIILSSCATKNFNMQYIVRGARIGQLIPKVVRMALIPGAVK
jgi:hypothetical protein